MPHADERCDSDSTPDENTILAEREEWFAEFSVGPVNRCSVAGFKMGGVAPNWTGHPANRKR